MMLMPELSNQVILSIAGDVPKELLEKVGRAWKEAGGPRNWQIIVADEEAWEAYRQAYKVKPSVGAFSALKARKTYLPAKRFQDDESLLPDSVRHEVLHILGRIPKER